ncbi:MAG TPA: hypothetical protein VGU46_10330 [Acidobacteriaceae bacterium]|nr:hypothetical protein [Acidobacteriaceae bacterium]
MNGSKLICFVGSLVLAVVAGCSGGGTAAVQPRPAGVFTASLDAETPLLTAAQRTALGFAYGPPDGTIGALATSNGNYMFFMAANSAASCLGSPTTEGTYRLGGTLTSISAPYGCTASMSDKSPDPNGYTFDQNYSGGGPVLKITSGGTTGILHIYHGEFHAGTCRVGSCFYSSLGMAVSLDGGATFSKLGEVVQPYVTRDSILSASRDLDVGSGTLVLGDGNGNFVANAAAADPTTLYVYVFYADIDPTLPAPCDNGPCFAVARAKFSDVIAAAFAKNTAAFPTLFQKFYNGSFSQAGTSGDANAAMNSGHYSPVVSAAGSFPSVIYDTATSQWVMVFEQGNDSVHMRHGSSLTNWSAVDDAGGSFTNAPNGEIYTTLLGESGDPNVSNGNPYLVYVKDTVPWPSWPNATVTERVVHLSLQ